MDDPFRKASTFEDLVLGLIIIDVHRIDGKDLLEIDNLGILFVDLNGSGPPIDGFHRKSGHGRRNNDDEKRGDDHPSPLLNDFPIISEINFLLLLEKRRRISWGRELVISFRGRGLNIIHVVLLMLNGPEGESKT